MINVELIDRHLLQNPSIIEEPAPNHRHNVCQYTFFSQNEIRISDIVRKIPFYFLSFSVVREHKFVKIGQMSNIVADKCDSVTNDRFLQCTYDNHTTIAFHEFLYGLPTTKLIFKHILETYSILLVNLTKLNEHRICFFNVSAETIRIRENYTPFLIGFDKSIALDELNEEYITQFIKNARDYTYKPIEVHILFYLICREEYTITYTLAETICSNYINQLPITRFFSRDQKSQLESSIQKFIIRFVNWRKSDIIIELLYSANTWDNYSLSVLYLHLLGTFQSVFTPLRIENAQSATSSSLITAPEGGVLNERMCNKSTVINKMVGMLINNIGPGRRSLISTTREKDEILSEWTEMELDADRIDELRTQLSY